MNNKALNYCGELNNFCAPLIKNTEITYFEHTRIFKDQKAFMLNNRPDYLQHFLEEKYSRPAPDVYANSGVFLWAGITDLLEYDNQILDMKNNFNIDNGICFVEIDNNYIDIYDFATKPFNLKAINFYLNNMTMLKTFFAEYKQKFKHVLIDLENNPLHIPLRPKNFKTKEKITTLFSNITKREIECLELLANGNTAKMTAKILKLSPRTIERHFENIKEKLGLRYKFELINKYVEYKLLGNNIT